MIFNLISLLSMLVGLPFIMPRLTWPHNIKLVDDVNEMCHHEFLARQQHVVLRGGAGSYEF